MNYITILKRNNKYSVVVEQPKGVPIVSSNSYNTQYLVCKQFIKMMRQYKATPYTSPRYKA